MKAKILIALAITLLLLSGVIAQNTGPVSVTISRVDDTAYPEMTVFFSVFSTQNGRAIPVTPNMVNASYNGQPLQVLNVQANESMSTALHLAIVFDLTSSQDQGFLDEQKRTAYTLIDNLNINDQISIITFDSNGTNTPVTLSNDHNMALNTIDMLAIVQGPSNTFRDGVQAAVESLQSNVAANARRAVVVMTDVTDPQGTATLTATTGLAAQLNTPIMLIGYNDADRAVLTEYSLSTGGFTYMQRELEEESIGLERLAQDIVAALRSEYIATLRSTSPATGQPSPLTLSVNVNGIVGQSVVNAVSTRRTIAINFPRLRGRPVVAGSVTFEPEIVYEDGEGSPELESAVYYIESGGFDNRPLTPPDTSNPAYTWDITDIAGGLYTIRLEVRDVLGNEGLQRVDIEVESPLTVSMKLPEAAASDETPRLEKSTTRVEVVVDGSYDVNQVRLLVDNQPVGQSLTAPPFVFEWDTSDLAGLYTLRAEASDVQGNQAMTEMLVQVSLGGGVIPPLLIAAAIIALLVVVLVVFSLRSRMKAALNLSGQVVEPPPTGNVSPVPTPSVAYLKVERGEVDNIFSYPLKDGENRLGRHRASNEIYVTGDGSSRNHACIEGNNGRFIIHDNQHVASQGNFTLVNGRPLSGQAYELQEGDRIQIGVSEMKFTRSN